MRTALRLNWLQAKAQNSLKPRLAGLLATACALVLLPRFLAASENVPHAPFGEWVNLPQRGQLEVGAFYQESEA